MKETAYWIWLQKAFGCGSHRINAIFQQFGSARAVYELGERGRLDSRRFTGRELIKMNECTLPMAEAVLEAAEKLECILLTPEDSRYPSRLRGIFAMPAVLYCRGAVLDLEKTMTIAMVGTRDMGEYGERATRFLAGNLARYGAVVVSGMAKGIDTAAVRAACRQGGRTVGVLGSGIDVLYPAENRAFMLGMIAHGHTILSEYPPGMEPMRGNFPQRNRIISGLSHGTVVVEAPLGSGSLITAAHALEQGRDVFAVPARINDRSFSGSLSLIADGAKPVTSAEDIVLEYEALYPQAVASLYKEQLDKLKKRREQIISARELREAQEGEWRALGKRGTRPAAARAPQKASFTVAVMPPREETPPPPPAKATAAYKPLPDTLSQEELLLLNLLTQGVLSTQTLAEKSELPVHKLLPALTELELSGLVVQVSPGRYRRND